MATVAYTQSFKKIIYSVDCDATKQHVLQIQLFSIFERFEMSSHYIAKFLPDLHFEILRTKEALT